MLLKKGKKKDWRNGRKNWKEDTGMARKGEGRREEKATQPKRHTRDESAEERAVNKRSDWVYAEGGREVCSKGGRRRKRRKGGGRATSHQSIPLPPFISSLSTPSFPPILFPDSFTIRISRAGDRASNPFPDAFLILRESSVYDRMGRGGGCHSGEGDSTSLVSYCTYQLDWRQISPYRWGAQGGSDGVQWVVRRRAGSELVV